jgi:hypothetical protein
MAEAVRGAARVVREEEAREEEAKAREEEAKARVEEAKAREEEAKAREEEAKAAAARAAALHSWLSRKRQTWRRRRTQSFDTPPRYRGTSRCRCCCTLGSWRGTCSHSRCGRRSR